MLLKSNMTFTLDQVLRFMINYKFYYVKTAKVVTSKDVS